MKFFRLPRFTRAKVAEMRTTERDRTIVRLVHKHRFLRSTHISALVGGSRQQILRRLKLLYHHGYLERPRAQIDYYHKNTSRHIAYGLGAKGAALLSEDGDDNRPTDWGAKNRSVGRIFLEHALLISDVMVAVELACCAKDIRLLDERELAPAKRKPGRRPFQWKVRIQSGTTLTATPDRVFALESNGTRTHFFLEADRGTMPVKRKILSQTSFHRKLLAYEATWTEGIHRRRFGFSRFRVVTVTTTAARADSLIRACATLKRGRGLFLFADSSVLDDPSRILDRVWQDAEREPAALLDWPKTPMN